MKNIFVLVSSIMLLISNLGNAKSWMYFHSSPQSYIAGLNHDLTSFDSNNGFVFEEFNSDVGFMSFAIHTPDWSEVWNIEFATPNGVDFRLYGDVGRYDGAQRSPFQESGHPGLSLSGDGRGYNQSSGWFDVFEFDRGEDGRVLHTLVHFYQQSEDFHGMRDSWEFGWISYDATVVPEPGTFMVASVGALGFLLFRRK